MKKLVATFSLLLITFMAFSQESSHLKNYVGTYPISDGPLKEVKVSIKDGKLFGSSEQGDAPLVETQTKDEFEIEGYGGSVKFIRENGIVKAMTMNVQGQEMKGVRKLPANTDYIGTYKFDGAPFESMAITADESTVSGEVEGMGKGAFDNTGNVDEFTESNYNSTITFKRNEKGIVNSVVILVQGSEMVGTKEMKPTMDEYLGTFEFEGAPFNELIVTMQNGKLHGNAVGQGEAEMAVTDKADEFEIVGYDGLATYVRNADGKISGIKLLIQGGEMEGKKK